MKLGRWLLFLVAFVSIAAIASSSRFFTSAADVGVLDHTTNQVPIAELTPKGEILVEALLQKVPYDEFNAKNKKVIGPEEYQAYERVFARLQNFGYQCSRSGYRLTCSAQSNTRGTKEMAAESIKPFWTSISLQLASIDDETVGASK